MNVKVEVVDVRCINGEGIVRAFVDVRFAEKILVRGFSVVRNTKGNLFVAMPRKASKDGRWYEIFTPTDENLKTEIETKIMEAYEEAFLGTEDGK